MILIGENIHTTSKAINEAIEGRNPEPLHKMAIQEAETGADYLDLNLGPLMNDPEEIMQWVVNTVQDVIDLPLCLDTTNSVAMEAGLKLCKKRPVINSANGMQDSKEKMLPLRGKIPCRCHSSHI